MLQLALPLPLTLEQQRLDIARAKVGVVSPVEGVPIPPVQPVTVLRHEARLGLLFGSHALVARLINSDRRSTRRDKPNPTPQENPTTIDDDPSVPILA